MNRLSFSQIQRYQMCPKSYEYYYVKKIRPPVHKSSLLFGKAIDAGLNVLLKTRSLEEAIKAFEEELSFIEEDGKKEPAAKNPKLVYAANDWDEDLFYAYYNPEDFKNGPQTLEEAKNQIEWHNFYHWNCLLFRGRILLETYAKEVLPQIIEAPYIQYPITIQNSNKDTITGFVDAIVRWQNLGLVLVDHKTAFTPYDANEVETSQQLSLYYWILKNKYHVDLSKAAYIVLLKKLKKRTKKQCKKCGHIPEENNRHKSCNAIIENKRCGGEWEEKISFEGQIQILISDISETVQEFVLNNVDQINYGITHQFFPANLTVCRNYWGGVCEYYSLCYKNKLTCLNNNDKVKEKEEQK